MDLLTPVLIGIGLSMDCLAVAIACGTSLKMGRLQVALVAGLAFGGFQAGMTIIGYAAGASFIGIISPYDHWVAFFLLAGIGVKMIYEATKEECGEERVDLLHFPSLLTLSFATSIDALAVGLSFAFLQTTILFPAAIIGAVTFVFSVTGILVGEKLAGLFGRKIEIIGGVILIAIGMRVLIEHLFFTGTG
jgi:putative Mn2+ efflux pump MntP